MKFCPNCGQQNQDDARFCVSCGSKMEVTQAPEAEPVNTESTAAVNHVERAGSEKPQMNIPPAA